MSPFEAERPTITSLFHFLITPNDVLYDFQPSSTELNNCILVRGEMIDDVRW